MKTSWMVTGVVGLVTVTLAGCGTVNARKRGDAGLYHGFGYDMEQLCNADEWMNKSGQGNAGHVPFEWPRGLLWVLDAPLSFVADTLLLPADALRSRSAEEKQQPEARLPDGAANGNQPPRSDAVQTSSSAESSRIPLR